MYAGTWDVDVGDVGDVEDVRDVGGRWGTYRGRIGDV